MKKDFFWLNFKRLDFDYGTRCIFVNSLILSVLMRSICMCILKVVDVLCEKWRLIQ